ncbi:hypothetical protein LTR62_007318 [Meristemomyces frigidus]|uniref:Uncharacterized protein n=1 Tax=Meristemomyces frigidus TaxID=1508187 RepID=A0AAN7YT55_9PEZI|nr:hypothetical protein LTR62_007318 [Meristemomyces frigidus]
MAPQWTPEEDNVLFTYSLGRRLDQGDYVVLAAHPLLANHASPNEIRARYVILRQGTLLHTQDIEAADPAPIGPALPVVAAATAVTTAEADGDGDHDGEEKEEVEVEVDGEGLWGGSVDESEDEVVEEGEARGEEAVEFDEAVDEAVDNHDELEEDEITAAANILLEMVKADRALGRDA